MYLPLGQALKVSKGRRIHLHTLDVYNTIFKKCIYKNNQRKK